MQTENCWLLPYIWTIMLKLHLIDLFSVWYTSKFATNMVTNRTDGAWALVYGSTSIDHERSMTLLFAVHRVTWRIFPNSTVVHTKMGHVSKTTPLLGVISHPFGRIWYSLSLYKIWELELQPFLRYGWSPQN